MGIDNWPWKLSEQLPQEVPLTLRELVGRPLRVVQHGHVVTQDYVSGRVTIYLGESGLIADFGVEKGPAGA